MADELLSAIVPSDARAPRTGANRGRTSRLLAAGAVMLLSLGPFGAALADGETTTTTTEATTTTTEATTTVTASTPEPATTTTTVAPPSGEVPPETDPATTSHQRRPPPPSRRWLPRVCSPRRA
jgi:hypothetical protein